MLATLATLAVLIAQRRPPSGPPSEEGGALAAILSLCCYGVLFLVFVVPAIAGMWKVFDKAGQPGWAAIIPIYNLIVLFQITDKPIWWIVLYFIPCVNVVSIVFNILVCIELAKRFGKDTGFGIGLAFLGFIFFPILGFGSAQWQGPGGPAPGVARRR